MPSKFEIKLDEAGYAKMLSTFAGLPKQFDRAAIRAINKTARWLRTQSVREISRETKIAQKHIRDRLSILKAKKTFKRALVTAGLRQIPASVFGIEKAKKTSTGVSIGRRNFPHAFIARMPKKGQKGRMEKGRWQSAATGKPSLWRRATKKRTPLVHVGIPIVGQASKILERQAARTGGILLKNMEYELNYEINVRGAHA